MIAPKIISFILLFYLSILIPNFWADKDIPHSYEIKIAVNRSDGGDVFPVKDFILKGAKGKVLEAKKQQPLQIEDVLNVLYGLDAEYIPKEKYDLNHNKSAKISLHKFNVPELDEMDIWTFANALGLTDPRWKLPDEKIDLNKHLFELVFYGHAMVALSIGDKEVIRFHFTKAGLNVFKSEEKKNYVVDKNLKEEFMEQTGRIRNRAFYNKEGFVHTTVRTKPMTIEKMKKIAIKLIDGRNLVYSGSDAFTCMHFTVAFVMAIVEEPERKKLLSITNWPKNFASLVQYAESVDKITPFEDVQKDEIFRKFVKLPHA